MVRWTDLATRHVGGHLRLAAPHRANLAALNVRVPGRFRAVRLARGTGLSLDTVTYVAATPTAILTPAPAPSPRR